MLKNEKSSKKSKTFMCGVCEGFYGKPWTMSQRLELFQRMRRFGMNTYLYAPKDDYKHRLDWRDNYSDEEAGELQQLINAAKSCNVNFVYALSPGLDIIYSSESDINCLRSKLQQVKSFGCEHFALLFDDIDDELAPEDSSHFMSFAEAQCSITNSIYSYLNEPDIFLFCPTEYCATRAEPSLQTSLYLRTIGTMLNRNIDLLWTGNKVVSEEISVSSIEAVSEIVKRKVTVWDNLHANDYDQTRLYLGPYSGRQSSLIDQLSGVLTNPNCEFHVNFIAFHTLAQWAVNSSLCFTQQTHPATVVGAGSEVTSAMDVDTESDDSSCPTCGDTAAATSSKYESRRALQMAVIDWLPELYRSTSVSDRQSHYATKPNCQLSSTEHKSAEPDTGADRQTSRDMIQEVDGHGEMHGNSEAESTGTGSAAEVEKQVASVGDRSNHEPSTLDDTINSSMPATNAATTAAMRPEVNDTRDDIIAASGAELCSAENRSAKLKAVAAAAECMIDKLTVNDVLLICHLFYLPYEHGPRAKNLLSAAIWLLSYIPTLNTDKATEDESDTEDARYEWYYQASKFQRAYRQVAAAVDKFVNIPNRQLLYELYPYITDMRSTLALVNSYIKWLGSDRRSMEDEFKSGDQEPWVYRGGLLAEFRRLLPIDKCRLSVKCNLSSKSDSQLYVIRPYFSSDKNGVFAVSNKLLIKSSSLDADTYMGGLLDSTGAADCYVLEDCDETVAGFAVCYVDVKSYFAGSELTSVRQGIANAAMLDGMPDDIISEYASVILLQLSDDVVESAASRRLLVCAVKCLQSKGCSGIHAVIPTMKKDSHLERIYLSVGFKHLSTTTTMNCFQDRIVLGKRF